MNIKILVSLVIAALLLVGCAANPGVNDNAAPAIDQEKVAGPVNAAVKPVTGASEPVTEVTELTAEEAQNIAFTHAGVTAADASHVRAKREKDDGIPVWDVEFRVGKYEYEYTLQAVTGEILEWDKEHDPRKAPAQTQPVETVPVETAPVEIQPVETVPAETAPGQTKPAQLTRKEAVAIALKDAELEESQISHLKAKKEKDDGNVVWEVEFRAGDYEYDYTISAKSGEILDKDKEYDPEVVPPVETQPVETAPVETTPVETKPAQLTREEALAIALEHAGLSESEVTDLKVQKDKDDGKVIWEVEFRSGDYEYEYAIGAKTSKIVDKDKEYDPVETQPAPQLTADEAVAIALEHAGRTAEQISRLEKELDEDDGKAVWEVEFYSEGFEYSYSISAKSGKILEWDKEKDD